MDSQKSLVKENDHKLIIALDNLSKVDARAKVEKISEECAEYMDRVIFKVNDLIADIWLKWVEDMFKWFDENGIMLDPKWFDIPATDANYIRKLSNYTLWWKAEFVTMHASNWCAWLKKAIDTRNELWIKTKILAVTALTTMDDQETNRIFDETSKHSVLKLAKEALDAWVDWIVCSPMEAELLRDVYKNYNFEIITPWVRFDDKKVEGDDQKRVMTPQKATEHGSNHIVMWRPILWSDDVKVTIERFFEEIKGVWYASDEQRHEFERLLYTWEWEELLRYIWAFYNRPKWGKYCRLASWLLSNAYINIWATERNYLVVERATNEMAVNIKNKWIEADVVMWAQMWSVRMSLYLAEKLWIEESVYTEKEEYDTNDSIILEKEGAIYHRKLPKEEQSMKLKRHDIDLTWKKVILSEDIVTKWSTLKKMIQLVKDWWWEVVAIACVWNRYWKDNYEWIPLTSGYTPPEFELYYDDQTPIEARWNYPKLSEWAKISEKPKNDWDELVGSMRNA